MSCIKTADPIDMRFGMKMRVVPRNYVLGGVRKLTVGARAILGFFPPFRTTGRQTCVHGTVHNGQCTASRMDSSTVEVTLWECDWYILNPLSVCWKMAELIKMP